MSTSLIGVSLKWPSIYEPFWGNCVDSFWPYNKHWHQSKLGLRFHVLLWGQLDNEHCPKWKIFLTFFKILKDSMFLFYCWGASTKYFLVFGAITTITIITAVPFRSFQMLNIFIVLLFIRYFPWKYSGYDRGNPGTGSGSCFYPKVSLLWIQLLWLWSKLWESYEGDFD